MNLGDLIYTRINAGETVMVCVSVGQITGYPGDDDDDDDDR